MIRGLCRGYDSDKSNLTPLHKSAFFNTSKTHTYKAILPSVGGHIWREGSTDDTPPRQIGAPGGIHLREQFAKWSRQLRHDWAIREDIQWLEACGTTLVSLNNVSSSFGDDGLSWPGVERYYGMWHERLESHHVLGSKANAWPPDAGCWPRPWVQLPRPSHPACSRHAACSEDLPATAQCLRKQTLQEVRIWWPKKCNVWEKQLCHKEWYVAKEKVWPRWVTTCLGIRMKSLVSICCRAWLDATPSTVTAEDTSCGRASAISPCATCLAATFVAPVCRTRVMARSLRSRRWKTHGDRTDSWCSCCYCMRQQWCECEAKFGKRHAQGACQETADSAWLHTPRPTASQERDRSPAPVRLAQTPACTPPAKDDMTAKQEQKHRWQSHTWLALGDTLPLALPHDKMQALECAREWCKVAWDWSSAKLFG